MIVLAPEIIASTIFAEEQEFFSLIRQSNVRAAARVRVRASNSSPPNDRIRRASRLRRRRCRADRNPFARATPIVGLNRRLRCCNQSVIQLKSRCRSTENISSLARQTIAAAHPTPSVSVVPPDDEPGCRGVSLTACAAIGYGDASLFVTRGDSRLAQTRNAAWDPARMTRANCGSRCPRRLDDRVPLLRKSDAG
jgi:hypothetical protein